MPHASLKLMPGVDQNKTPTLNEAAISESQLIRFVPDRTMGGLVQKIGGWAKFFAQPINSKIRSLWAWEDLNVNSRLAIGAEGLPAGGGNCLTVLLDNSLDDITPETTLADDIAVAFTTTEGSAEVIVTDAGRNVGAFDSVFISPQISVGGLIIYGFYPCIFLGPNTYKIIALDAAGYPWLATSSVTSGGVVPQLETTVSTPNINVTLPNHNLFVGSTFAVIIPVDFGSPTNLTLYGQFTVQEVIDENEFVIFADVEAGATTTQDVNGGYVDFKYYRGIGPLPEGTGYGIGPYGRGTYGRGTAFTASPGTPINATDWTLDNWGDTLVACPLDGPVCVWSPDTGLPIARPIGSGPYVNDGIFVAMPQRQIVAWGSTFNGFKDPLLIRWSDSGNYDSWIAQPENQAGSYRIPKGSRIVQCIQGPQQSLVWTDVGMWSMQYIGPPYVYSFNEVGSGCGLIGRKAAASVNNITYWMGPSQFYRYAGGGVEVVNCPVWDVIFQDLDQDNLDRIRVAPNSRFNEIAWYYPTTTSNGEVAKYVKYNYALNTWDYGTLSRTAWINESVLGAPIGAGSDTYIYQHEVSPDAAGQPINSSFQTGYFVLSEGNEKLFIDQIWPDMKWGYFGEPNKAANVKITFFVADYPNSDPVQHGPYTMTREIDFITPRLRGRLVSIKVESSDIGSWWRLGNIRYRFQLDGKF
jgi:hypothetical protein